MQFPAVCLKHGLSIALFLTILAACETPVALSPSGRVIVPKHPHWHYGDIVSKNAALLPDPNSLYVEHYSREGTDGYTFYRFWPNGRVLRRNLIIQGRKPTARDGDEFLKGGTTPGRYEMEGNVIRLEFFNDYYREYRRSSGILRPDALLEEDAYHQWTKYERMRFPAGAMQDQPDW